MIDEFKKTLKLLSDRKNILFDIISTENNQEEINQILNNIYEIDKKIKEYDQYINEYKSSKIIENMDNNTKNHFTEDNMKGKKVPKDSIKIFSIIFDDLYSFI
jgi:hypothetical protein